MDEDSTDVYPPTFFGQLVKKWEESVTLPKDIPTRVVKVRTGVVFGNDGALKSLVPPFRWGVATVAGSGKQYFPWIHIRDIAGIFDHAIENENVTGILNGVSPEAATAMGTSFLPLLFEKIIILVGFILRRCNNCDKSRVRWILHDSPYTAVCVQAPFG